MAKGKFVKAKKRRFWPFALFMLIYAVAVLIAVELGLQDFWDYIAAYEDSRPKHVLNAYMDSLDGVHISDLSSDVIAQIDHNIQSEEECREYIQNAVSGGISYAKKSSESTDTRHVYMLRTGTQVIGSFTMEVTHEDEYGFTYWEVTEESFDMSYLIGEAVSTVAPDHYTVTVNGSVLDSSYITGDPIEYEALEMFYDDYTLPAMVTYQAGPFLGEFDMVITDTEGDVVIMENVEDISKLAENCSEEQVAKLDSFADEFLNRYVTYMSGANKSADANLHNLLKYVVDDSDFEERMIGALYGQQATQSRGDVIKEIRNNYFFKLESGRYVCDITYMVDTTGKQGVVTTTNNVRIIVVDTEDGLRVLTVYNY